MKSAKIKLELPLMDPISGREHDRSLLMFDHEIFD